MPSARRLAIALALLLASLPVLAADKKDADKDEKEKPKWDVNDPPGPRSTVPIDTREGTWMSARRQRRTARRSSSTCSGDLYTLPIGGGEAKRAHLGRRLGHAAALLARTARSIAFTSDRGGGDNIWVMERDGTNAEAGDQGDLPPAQQPGLDAGRRVHRRRASTSPRTRSLGAGEIWLYHRSGGDGAAADQEAERAEGPRRAGASRPTAATSTTARTPRRARSSSTTRTRTSQIYVIQRLDRATRRDRALRHRAGRRDPADAVARRQVARLHPPRARQVASLLRHGPRVGRRARRSTTGLDRDMQETWAIHGVYPAHGLDARTARASSSGRAARSTASTSREGAVADIPFHVARHAPGRRRGALPRRGRAGRVRRARCCAGSQVSPQRRQGRLPGARAHLCVARPAGRARRAA